MIAKHQRASTFIEMTAAIALLAVGITMLGKLNGTLVNAQHQLNRQDTARRLVANAMERLQSPLYDSLDAIEVGTLQEEIGLDDTALPDAEMNLIVNEHDGGKRLTLRISWSVAGRARTGLEIVRWRYPEGSPDHD